MKGLASVVDKSPEEAKKRSETTTSAKVAQDSKHISDLKRVLGEVGGSGGELVVGTDQYGQLILFKSIRDKQGREIRREEIFFWVQPDGVTFSPVYGAALIKKVKESYKGNLEVLRKDLYDKNLLSETDFKTKDETAFNQAIIKAGRNYSLTQVQRYTVDGETKFSPFTSWITGLGSAERGGENLPTRDINLYDRDVIEALVKDVYMNETGNAPDQDYLDEKTNYYMDVIKKGTLTTAKKAGGKVIRKSTPGFSEARVRAELPKEIAKEQPMDVQQAKSVNFITFLASMEGRENG